MSIDRLSAALLKGPFTKQSGTITAVHGMLVEARGCSVGFGEIVDIVNSATGEKIPSEVVGVREHEILLMPFADVVGLDLNSIIMPSGKSLTVPAGWGLLGRVIDPLGRPLDEKPDLVGVEYISTHNAGINPLYRVEIRKKVCTGVKVIDLLTPIGDGQRIGIFAGSGVGKSTLLGMIAKFCDVDVIVIALVGERGREVGDFIRDSLGESGLSKAILIVATAADPAVIRRQAAYTATAIAAWCRRQGKRVMLMMDSVTRFAMAQREIGIATGEAIGARGYPPSVFAALPPLVEQCGNVKGEGSVTAVYTVLVEGDDLNEPISDHMRSLLDGHISLSRELAAKGHFPAVDVLHSLSRLSNELYEESHKAIARKIRNALAVLTESKDLVDLGLYKRGNNPALDKVLQNREELDRLLTQQKDGHPSEETLWNEGKKIADLL